MSQEKALQALPWERAARGARLLGTDGSVAPTIFEEMTMAAQRHDAINLGQGFPDTDGPRWIVDAAVEAMREGANQYAPGSGTAALREAVAAHQHRWYGLSVDPVSEVVATTGATEGIAAALLAFVSPGDNVVAFEPFYDSYGAIAALAGAELRTVPLLAPGFEPDLDRLRAAVDEKTAVILVNDPHNPTGARFSDDVRAELVRLADEHDAVLVADEVYEHLVFDAGHVPLAAVPGAWERTLTLSSAGKTFSLTGWKVGWAVGPRGLVTALRTVKQFLSYSSGPAFQLAIAQALDAPTAFFSDRAADLKRRCELLSAALEETGATVLRPRGGYFTLADLAPLGVTDATTLCRRMPQELGVVGIPVGVFCAEGNEGPYASMVRFAHCKRDEVIVAAAERLRAGLPAMLGGGA